MFLCRIALLRRSDVALLLGGGGRSKRTGIRPCRARRGRRCPDGPAVSGGPGLRGLPTGAVAGVTKVQQYPGQPARRCGRCAARRTVRWPRACTCSLRASSPHAASACIVPRRRAPRPARRQCCSAPHLCLGASRRRARRAPR
ncbi:hypothetical protein OH687_28655 [Burkholderia anthina]|nr:hypothetical protein OH687_28655 [Burkholderia anthina]